MKRGSAARLMKRGSNHRRDSYTTIKHNEQSYCCQAYEKRFKTNLYSLPAYVVRLCYNNGIIEETAILPYNTMYNAIAARLMKRGINQSL